jgi:arginyl-tRNA synthetase
VLGADKKMFKTRSGDTIRLADLLDEAVARAAAIVAEKNPDRDPDARAALAAAIGIGAVKYADLSNDRVKDYVFDWDRMLSLDGNTAPYMQYAHARVRSILRRAGEAPDASRIAVTHAAERALCLALLAFGDVAQSVATAREPHRLCTYLFELAGAFTRVYEQCPVLKAGSDAERASRIALCDLTARVLSQGLWLLGIEAPHQM